MAYPDTFQNRTRTQVQDELLEFVGGVGRTDAASRAGLAWDAAVREFNSVAWRFNIRTTDVTLINDQQEYTLPDKVRSPVRCHMVDSNGRTRTIVWWIPYTEWLLARPDQSTGASIPSRYTMQNIHETGNVILDPRPLTPFTYPTARLTYATWIDLQPTAGSKLDVPSDVDEAIFQLATAKLMSKNKRYGKEAIAAFQFAKAFRNDIERNHRIFGEITIRGASG